MEKILMNRRLAGGLGLLILFGIIVAVNLIVAAFQIRGDLTEDKLYTLSDGTNGLLGELERDVTLKFYYSQSSESVPIALKQFAQRIRELLREYEINSRGRVVLEAFDPKPDSDEEEWAQRYGVTSQSMNMMGAGDPLYLGLVAVSGAQESVIPFFSPSQEAQLEYMVTRLVHEVTQSDKPQIGIISGLPVLGAPAASPYGGPQGGSPPWVFVTELRRNYDVVEIGAGTDSIPPGVDVLLMIQPKSLSDGMLFAVDQFLLQGGRIVAFLDPMAVSDQAASNPMMMNQGGDISNLNTLLGAWGLTFSTDQVMADLQYATRIRTRQGGAARNVAWLSLTKEAVAGNEVATSSLENMLMVCAGSFSGEPAVGLELTELIRTSDQNGTVNAFESSFSEDGGLRNMTPKNEAATLALRLAGTFKTAFPEGAPAATPADGTTPPPPAGLEGLKESATDGVVVLVGDVDLLNDRFCFRQMNFFGQTVFEPLNDNMNFMLNMVEQLAGSEALIGLRSRGTFDRPFTRVQDLETKAQDQWREEEKKLQDNMQQAQARLNELQANKDPQQLVIISPEQQAEIDRFEDELLDTRKKLKEVRKNLRKDIEKLGLQVKVANIVLVPLLIAVFGIIRGVKRRMD